jgi:hypothetical protein
MQLLLVMLAQSSRPFGLTFVAVMAGVCCGIIPFKLAESRARPGLGVICLALCAVAGFFGGLLFGLPLAGLLALAIHLGVRR